MRKAILILLFSFLLFACNKGEKQSQSSKWNDGYDPKHPECFDTVVCENDDSLFIINMTTDFIL